MQLVTDDTLKKATVAEFSEILTMAQACPVVRVC